MTEHSARLEITTVHRQTSQ